MTVAMLEAKNRPGFFVRHQNFEGGLDAFESARGEDFHFEIVDLGRHLVRLRSANFPRRFLRPDDTRVVLEERPARTEDAELFDQESLFELELGLDSNDGLSFRSVHRDGHYLRHLDGRLCLGAADGPGVPPHATFFKRAPR
ncbi:AbfB domain-containing protein [Kitasatospora sp. NPDC094015]|uniref:AbfB domain-containing protein n=1 Tax=Kitasatospora sp. NPDC094015 TaxID=3155205 RepID=UPI00332C8906